MALMPETAASDLPEERRAYLASGVTVHAVLSSLQGDHDRDVLPPLQDALGADTPVLSWKMLFAPLTEQPVHDEAASLAACRN